MIKILVLAKDYKSFKEFCERFEFKNAHLIYLQEGSQAEGYQIKIHTVCALLLPDYKLNPNYRDIYSGLQRSQLV